MEREMTDRQIAYHLLFVCVGDHCSCCDWAEGDAAVMAGMNLDTAQRIVDTVGEDEDWDNAMRQGEGDYDSDRSERDYADYSDDGDALASAGWGTDEDYGHFGGEE